MNISSKKVVSMHYTLTNTEGATIDATDGINPFSYLHGASNIIVGLEKALEGKQVGDKVSVSIDPREGYGEIDPSLQQEVAKSMFDAPEIIQEGMQFQADNGHDIQVVTVKEVKADTVVIDANHPLAGVQLHFDVEIVDVREATHEEWSHGHVHTHGHHH